MTFHYHLRFYGCDFDKIIKPIVFYCMGVKFGGLQAKNDIIDRVHLKFCKLLLEIYVIW
jgi:hypothetical protein